MKNGLDIKIGLPMGPRPEKDQKTMFDDKAFAEYLKYQFMCLKNIKTDDICTENNSDEAQEKHVSMSKAFIDLEFTERTGKQFSFAMETLFNNQYDFQESQKEEKCFVQDIWNKLEYFSKNGDDKRIVYLLGSAGAGKSTLTQYIALLSWATWLKTHKYYSSDVDEFLDEQKTGNYVSEDRVQGFSPIALRIKLSDYGRFIDELNRNNKESGVNYFFAFNCWFDLKCRDDKKYKTINDKYKDWITELDSPGMAQDILYYYDKMLNEKDNQIVFLFDGLDEVKNAREILIPKIKTFLKEYVVKNKNGNIAIITSRYEKMNELIDSEDELIDPNSFHEEGEDARDGSLKKHKESLKEHIRKCELLPLSKSKVEECVHDFCTAKYKGNDASDTEAAILKAYEKQNIRDIMKTPLEVTMICLVYQGNREIPGNDTRLYKSYINMYYSREKSKLLTDNRYRSFLECEYTEDFVYHLLKWSCYMLEIEAVPRLKKEDIWAEIEQYNTCEEDGRTYRVYETVTGAYINLLIEFTFERLNLFSPYYNEGYEMDGDIHKTVKEFLSAYYVLTENNDQFADNIIKMQLKEENKTLEFITCLLINSADKTKDTAYTSEIKEDFSTGEEKAAVLDHLKTTLKLGASIAKKRFALPIYEHDRAYEPRLIAAWAGQFVLDVDVNQDELIEHFFSRYNSNTVQREIFFEVINQLMNNGVFNINIFKLLVLIIENDIFVDPLKYKAVANMLSSDLFNSNILQTARKYKAIISKKVLEKILNKGISINIYADGVRAVNDLETIIIVERFRNLIGLDCVINCEQKYRLDSKEEILVDYNYQKSEGHNTGLSLITERLDCKEPFSFEDYIQEKKQDKNQCDSFIKQMITELKQCGLDACSDLMNCIFFPNDELLVRFSEQLSSKFYDAELSGIIMPSFERSKIRKTIPARLVKRHFDSSCKLSSKEIVDHYLDAQYEEILHAEEKTPIDAFRKIVLLDELLEGLFICTGRNILETTWDDWYEQFNEVEQANDLHQYEKYWDMYAFLFSIYGWSCQQIYRCLPFDSILDSFKTNSKALEKALFEKTELIGGYIQCSLILYMLARKEIVSVMDQLKHLSLEKMYTFLPRFIDEQLELNLTKETLFKGKLIHTILQNAYVLIKYHNALQYWDFFLICFLLLRKNDDMNYAKTFLCEILDEAIVPTSNKKTEAMFKVIMKIKALLLADFSNVRTIARDIFNIIENVEDDRVQMLKLIVRFMDENFNDDKYKKGTSELFCELISLTRRCNGKYHDVNLIIEAILRKNLHDIFFPKMIEEK